MKLARGLGPTNLRVRSDSYLATNHIKRDYSTK